MPNKLTLLPIWDAHLSQDPITFSLNCQNNAKEMFYTLPLPVKQKEFTTSERKQTLSRITHLNTPLLQALQLNCPALITRKPIVKRQSGTLLVTKRDGRKETLSTVPSHIVPRMTKSLDILQEHSKKIKKEEEFPIELHSLDNLSGKKLILTI